MTKVKKLAVVGALLLLAGCQCLPEISLRPVRAAIYMGDGALGVGEYHWLQIVTFAEGMDTTLVDAKAIRSGALEGMDLLIMPGGRSLNVSSALGEEGERRVMAFIRGGGGYIGSCAGAFLGLPTLSREDAGRVDMAIRFNARAEELVGISERVQRVTYAGGPISLPPEPIPDAEVDVIATYDSDLPVRTDKPLPARTGQAAIVAGRVGEGRVFISTVHPEADLADHFIAEAALRFVTGHDIIWEIPQRTRGQLVVGVDMGRGFGTVAAAEAMQALLEKDEYDFIPVDDDILNAGMVRHVDAVIKPDAAGFAQLVALKELPNDAFGCVTGAPGNRGRGALSVAVGEACGEECFKALVCDRRFDVRVGWDDSSLKHLDAVILGASGEEDFNDALRAFVRNGGTVVAVAQTPQHREAMMNIDGITVVGSYGEVPVALGALCPSPCENARLVAESVSPDGRNAIRLYVNPLGYEVLRNGTPVVLRTPIDLEIDGKGLARDQVKDPVVTQTPSGSGMTPADTYKKAYVSLEGNGAFADFGDWGVRLAARNDGVAWRFETKFKGEVTVTHERAGLVIPSDANCHAAYTTGDGQEQCHPETLEAAELRDFDPEHGPFIYLPFVFRTDGAVVAVSESDLFDFPVWNVARRSPKGAEGPVVLESVYGRWPTSVVNNAGVLRTEGAERQRQWLVSGRANYLTRCDGARTFPWRCFILSDDYSGLCESDLIYALARKNGDMFMDFSWVRPGKVAWEWWNAFDNIGDPAMTGAKNGCTTATYRRFIDFAAQNHIEYVIMDEGWSEKLNIWKFAPEVDVPALIQYGREKGVGIILWMAWAQIDGDEEHVAEHFAKLGVRGFKVDFMDRGDAQVERFLWTFADACARHKLLVDWHGAHRPTGQHRAYPNVLNYEAVHGLEVMKFYDGQEDFMDNDVKNFFVRMTAGPLDYTPGAMLNYPKGSKGPADFTCPGSFGTRCHQMALMSMFEAPLQMLCDSPTHYEQNPECLAFMAKTPVVWEDVKGLGGTPDTYAAVARKAKDGAWWVSAITNWEPREIVIDTSFLGAGDFEVEIFRDAPDCATEPTHYFHESFPLAGGETLKLSLAPGGGAALRITRCK